MINEYRLLVQGPYLWFIHYPDTVYSHEEILVALLNQGHDLNSADHWINTYTVNYKNAYVVFPGNKRNIGLAPRPSVSGDAYMLYRRVESRRY